ncbi:MAG: lipocalin-like domain-containing protein [Gemmatimonadota bacterium]
MRTLVLMVIVITGSLLPPPSGLQGQSTVERLQGAWRVVDLGQTGSPGAASGSTQPGLLLFAGDHYSYTLVTRPRPDMPQGLSSPEELLTVWNPFTANAGTFEVSGDTMIRRPVVAKNPSAMGQGIYNEYTFRLSADTLWITTVGTETGAARNPRTVRYERAR